MTTRPLPPWMTALLTQLQPVETAVDAYLDAGTGLGHADRRAVWHDRDDLETVVSDLLADLALICYAYRLDTPFQTLSDRAQEWAAFEWHTAEHRPATEAR